MGAAETFEGTTGQAQDLGLGEDEEENKGSVSSFQLYSNDVSTTTLAAAGYSFSC